VTEAPVSQKTTVEENLPEIESKYEFGGPIPRILIENSDYQKATVGSAVDEEHVGLFEREKTQSEKIIDSLVNIYCHYKTDDYTRTTTGTGFFIHKNGVVLTNAHVAQFLLLKETDAVTDARCILRGGSPAEPLYETELLYISPLWISKNANLIDAEKPTGTGERDYALLYVSKAIGDRPLPSVYPALTTNTGLLPRSVENDVVLAGGYPAEALYKQGASVKLVPLIGTTTIEELYTFGSNYADLFSIGGSSVGEQGSSGGPIVRENAGVIGLIVTKGDEALEGARSLRGLTLSYIDRTITEETGFSLEETMRGDLEYRGNVFKNALVPFLSSLLNYELEG